MSDEKKPEESGNDDGGIKYEVNEGESKDDAGGESGESKDDKKKDVDKKESGADDGQEDKGSDKNDSPKKDDVKLKLPEGTHLTDADKKRVEAFAKEHGIKKDLAQELLNKENESRADNLLEDRKKQVAGWVQDVKDDSEIGGDNYNKSIKLAKQVVGKFGTESLMNELNETGYGSHPEVVRMFARIGKAMSSDSFVKGGGTPPGEKKKSLAERLYDKS